MRERIGRVKVRKLVGWDKHSLIGKAKTTHTSKSKEGIISLLPIGRQVFNHLQESRALSHVTGRRMPSLRTSTLPSSFHSFILLSMMSYGVEHLCGQLAVSPAVPAVSPPNFLCTPSPLAGGAELEAEKAFTLCEHCSAMTKTSLCYQHCFQHKCKT